MGLGQGFGPYPSEPKRHIRHSIKTSISRRMRIAVHKLMILWGRDRPMPPPTRESAGPLGYRTEIPEPLGLTCGRRPGRGRAVGFFVHTLICTPLRFAGRGMIRGVRAPA